MPDDAGQRDPRDGVLDTAATRRADDDDEINSSLCHGFIFDLAGVEVDRMTGQVRIDRYMTMHDCGTHSASRHGRRPDHAAASRRRSARRFYEEYAYGADGTFLTGTFADYLVPTAMPKSRRP